MRFASYMPPGNSAFYFGRLTHKSKRKWKWFFGIGLSGMSGKGVCRTEDSVQGAAGTCAGLQRASVKGKFKPDFICLDKIVVELKTVSGLANEHRGRKQNYLRATRLKLVGGELRALSQA
jgi:PD-(D/E)XK nuclease superfamily protein